MNERIEYYIELRNKLKEISPIGSSVDLLLTGSISLNLYGILDESQVGKDLDMVIVNPSKEAKELLDATVLLFPPKKDKEHHPSDTDNDNVGVGLVWQFKHNDFNVDIFSQKFDNRVFILEDQDFGRLKLSPIMATVEAKKIMNREKDWAKLQVIKQNFEKKVNTVF